MKKLLISICWLLGMATAHAQNEENIEWQPATKSFGGFLLDMTLMNLQAPPRFSEYRLEVPDASKDYSRLFRLDNSTLYTQGLSDGGILYCLCIRRHRQFRNVGKHPYHPANGQFPTEKRLAHPHVWPI